MSFSAVKTDIKTQPVNTKDTKTSNDTPITHVLIHMRVRNDDHCPRCRRYYVSFHTSWDNAYKTAIDDIDEDHEDEPEKTDKIKKELQESCCWIDEWVRRSNGDLYQIRPVLSGMQWNLSVTDIQNYSVNTIIGKAPSYMGVYIKVDKSLDCPDNIQFSIVLNSSFEKANECTLGMRELYEGKHDEDDIEAHNALSLQLDKEKWIEDSDGVGHSFHVISIERNRGLGLNSFCAQIQPKNWENQ